LHQNIESDSVTILPVLTTGLPASNLTQHQCQENQDIQHENEVESVSDSKLQIADVEIFLAEEMENSSETVKKQFEEAQLTIEDLSTSNKIIEDQLRFRKVEVSALRMKNDDFLRTKIALLETQQKLLEIQKLNESQRDEISVCKNVIGNVLQNQAVAEKMPMKRTVLLAQEDNRQYKNRDSQTLLHWKLEYAHTEIERLNALLLKSDSSYQQSPSTLAAIAVSTPPSQSLRPLQKPKSAVPSPNLLGGGESTGNETETDVEKLSVKVDDVASAQETPKIGVASFAVVVYFVSIYVA